MIDVNDEVRAGGRGLACVLGGSGLAFLAMFLLPAGRPDRGGVEAGPRPASHAVPGHPGPIVAFLAGYPELGRPAESARLRVEGKPERWRVVTSRGLKLVFVLHERAVVDVRREEPDGRQTSIMIGPALEAGSPGHGGK